MLSKPILPALALVAAVTAAPAPVHAVTTHLPYEVYWSDIHFDEHVNDWVEHERFEGHYATLAKARSVARAVARQHYMQETFPVDISWYDEETGDLTRFELYYTGGDVEVRIARDGQE